jgi:hypothetical protein
LHRDHVLGPVSGSEGAWLHCPFPKYPNIPLVDSGASKSQHSFLVIINELVDHQGLVSSFAGGILVLNRNVAEFDKEFQNR